MENKATSSPDSWSKGENSTQVSIGMMNWSEGATTDIPSIVFEGRYNANDILLKSSDRHYSSTRFDEYLSFKSPKNSRLISIVDQEHLSPFGPSTSARNRGVSYFAGMKCASKSPKKVIDEEITYRKRPSKFKTQRKGNICKRIKNTLLDKTVEKYMAINMKKMRSENEELKALLEEKERLLKEKEVYILNLIDEFNKYKIKQQDIYDVTIQELKDKVESQQKAIDKMQHTLLIQRKVTPNNTEPIHSKDKNNKENEKIKFESEDNIEDISDIRPADEDLINEELVDKELFEDVFDEKYENSQCNPSVNEELNIK